MTLQQQKSGTGSSQRDESGSQSGPELKSASLFSQDSQVVQRPSDHASLLSFTPYNDPTTLASTHVLTQYTNNLPRFNKHDHHI